MSNQKKKNEEQTFDEVDSLLNNTDSDDVIPEDEEQNPALALKKLRDKLKVCEKDKQEYLLGWQRAKADFVNSRKQSETEKMAFVTFAENDLISELLPVISSFDVATTHINSWEKAPKEWRIGIESIFSLLLGTLKSRGLVTIDPPLNTIFDPSKHEAIERVAVLNEADDNKILKVIEKGYELQGKIIKAARVSVGQNE